MALDLKLEQLPTRPGVYLFKGADGAILYVGKARVLRDRVRSYFQASRPTELHKARMVEEIADVDLVVTDSEMEALALENNLIKRHKPPYNLRLRDDKNHPYLKLTLAEEYPRLYVVRRPSEDGNAYGGPYIPASLGRKTAGLVRKLFGIRSCKEALDGKRPRPCLQFQIKRCIAPCVAEVCSLDRYRRSCEDARLFLEGRTEEVVKRLRGQMEAAAGEERFEEAASLRDQVKALLRMEAPQKITTTDIEERDLFAAHVEGDRAAVQAFSVRDGKVVAREGFLLDRLTEPEAVLASTLQQFYASGRYVPREVLLPGDIPDRELLEEWLSARRGTAVRIHVPQRGEKLHLLDLVARNARLAFELEWKHPRKQSQEILRALRDVLDLEVEPQRIECFDVSNIQGSDVVASMVVFEAGLAKKSDYRKFRVKGLSGAPDDFASMREVVGRRYKRLLEEGKDLPDLVLVDGGKGQLGAATDALDELGLGDQPVASLAKREELLFVRGREGPIALPRSSPVLQLVQRVRDEAHRFAVGFHRQARSSRTLRSELDGIDGIGPARRRKLLSVFGSVRGVRGATEAELAAVVGKATAARVRRHFEGTAKPV
ncbi:MAG TPA: excinuclease ABC subunit UvrC [Vicinamibacteria bacterium]